MMQKGKRYRVKTMTELLLDGWECDPAGGWLSRPDVAGVILLNSPMEHVLGTIQSGRTYNDGTPLVELSCGPFPGEAVVELSDDEYSKWSGAAIKSNWQSEDLHRRLDRLQEAYAAECCTHTNPDGSAAWINQGFMHVLMACRICGQKKDE